MKLLTKLPLLFGASLMLASCGKSYTCSHSIDYVLPSIVFKGFAPNQLNKVVVQKFKLNSNFSQFIETDTVNASNCIMKGDTAVGPVDNGGLPEFSYRGFYVLYSGYDYKITIPATQQTYSVTEIYVGNEELQTWTEKEPCSPGSSMSELKPYTFKLNQVAYTAFSLSPHSYLVCLSH